VAAVALLVTDGVTPGGQDVTADGEKFLINTLGAEAAASPITVALNWQAGLKNIFLTLLKTPTIACIPCNGFI
jgi:hypothetical protein